MSEENIQTLGQKMADTVARLVTDDDAGREALLARIAAREAVGQDAARDPVHGFDFPAFCVYFAREYPISTVMVPGAATLYLYLLYMIFWG